MSFWKWSKTSATNASSDGTINWAEGMPPAAVNDSGRAMMAAAAKWRDDISGTVTTGGTSTNYTVTSNQVFDTLAHLAGAMIAFVPHATNGATVTINVDGLGAKPLRSAPGIELPSGVMVLGTPYVATYNNSDGAFYLQNFFINPSIIPIGAMVPWTGDTAPNSSFVIPVGQAISRTTYATYFGTSGVGTRYGVGDGSTTFNVPDLRGRAVFQPDSGGSNRITVAGGNFDGTVLGGTGGLQNHTLLQAELPAFKPAITITDPGHTHGISGGNTAGPGPIVSLGSNFGGTPNTASSVTGITAALTSNLGSGTPLTVLPPAIVLPYILRII